MLKSPVRLVPGKLTNRASRDAGALYPSASTVEGKGCSTLAFPCTRLLSVHTVFGRVYLCQTDGESPNSVGSTDSAELVEGHNFQGRCPSSHPMVSSEVAEMHFHDPVPELRSVDRSGQHRASASVSVPVE